MIYFVQRADGKVKIGYTDFYKRRLSELENEYGRLIGLGIMDGSLKDESRLHAEFSADGGRREWFRPSDRLLAYIAENASPISGFGSDVMSVKLPTNVHSAILIMQQRYSVNGVKPTMQAALTRFIQQHDPEVFEQAKRVVALREQIANILGDDD